MAELQAQTDSEQASTEASLQGWKFSDVLPGPLRRHPKRLMGVLGLLGVAGGAGYLIHESMQPEPQQEISIGKTICLTETQEEDSHTSIDFDGQEFTFGTSTDGTEVLVRLTADLDGTFHDIDPIDGISQRKVDEAIEIFDAHNQGVDDDEVLMSIWYESEPAELVVSVPCE